MGSLRYRTIRNPDKYGQVVFKHLEDIKGKLLGTPPNRQQWLRLVKDICGYALAARAKKSED